MNLSQQQKQRYSWMFFIFASLTGGLCSFLIGKPITIVLGFLATFCLVLGYRLSGSNGLLTKAFISTLLLPLITCYWIPKSLNYFGGYNFFFCMLLFLAYMFLSAFQFVIVAWLSVRMQKTILARFNLALPAAWLVAEIIYPRIFPFSIAITMISFHSFSGLAQIVGIPLLSALLIWWVELFIDLPKQNFLKRSVVLGLVVFVPLAVGHHLTEVAEQRIKNADIIKVALVQGNLDPQKKRDQNFFSVNLERYQALSFKAIQEGVQLLVWPESVFNQPTPENIGSIFNTIYDPLPGSSVPLIYGLISISGEPTDRVEYNSVCFASEGTISSCYKKRTLMPFGEYIPLSKIIPFLGRLNVNKKEIDVGKQAQPLLIKIKSRNGSQDIKFNVFPSICYEDLRHVFYDVGGGNFLPGVLASFSNDAWFGDSIAPYQHNLLASWRAIESRQFMIRATNTGFTAIIDPLGRTVSSLQTFKADYLIGEISLLPGKTFYDRYGEILSLVFCFFCMLLLLSPTRIS